MGMCLTYSLFHPHEALQIKNAMEKEQEEFEEDQADFQPPGPLPLVGPVVPALPAPQAPNPNPELHALDPQQHQIVSLDSALVPYEPQNNGQPDNNAAPVPDFDIQTLLQEFHNSTDDNDLVLAATQIEKDNFSSKTTMMKKTSSPNMHPAKVFQNCTFGNIGSLNIHIHKH